MSIVHHLHIPAILAFSVPGELWLVPLLAVSLATAALAGVLPPRHVAARIVFRPPTRLASVGRHVRGPGRLPLLGFALRNDQTPSVGSNSTTQPQDRPASETAFISTVPPLLGFLALLLGSHFSRDVSGQDLASRCTLAQAGQPELIGVVIVVPPLYLAQQAVEWIYRRVHYRAFFPPSTPSFHTLEKSRALPSLSPSSSASV